MAKSIWIRGAALAAAAAGLALAGALLACSESETQEMDRGRVVDDEVAMPTDPSEMRMTEEERRAKAAAQDEALEQREFNDSGQGDDEPRPQVP